MKNTPLLITAIVSAILIVLVYMPTFSWMQERFDAEESSYSHGYLIPFVSAFLIWNKKSYVRTLPIGAHKGGLVLIVAALMANFFAQAMRLHFVSGFSLPIVLAGIVLVLWGGAIFRAVLFPLVFLGFMVPVPNVLLIHASFRLKLLVSFIAARAAQLINIPVEQAGALLSLPNAQLVVDYACSGLRSLISLLALGTLFAYFLPATSRFWKRAVLVVSAIPIAVAANVVRVFMMIFFAFVYGEGEAMHVFHDISGFIVFAVAFGLLMLVAKMVTPRS